MAIVQDNFESKSTAKWDSEVGGPTVDETGAIWGDSGFAIDVTAGAANYVTKSFASLTSHALRARFYIDTSDYVSDPSGGQTVIEFYQAAAWVGELIVKHVSDGTLSLSLSLKNDAAVVDDDSYSGTHDHGVFCIEIACLWDDGAGYLKVYLDGVEVASLAALNNDTMEPDEIWVGATDNTVDSSGPLKLDQIIVAGGEDAIGCLTEYGTDAFELHPEGLDSIVFGWLNDSLDSGNFFVSPGVEIGAEGRESVEYSEARLGGFVKGTRIGLSTITFHGAIVAEEGDAYTAQIVASRRFRELKRAVTNPDGGHLKFKPRGLVTQVLPTYYKFLKSKPPEMVKSALALDKDLMRYNINVRDPDNTFIILYSCNIQTWAMGLSDPESPFEIIPETETDNCCDGTYSNVVPILSGDILGDFLIPITRIIDTGGCDLVAHFRKCTEGEATDHDILEAEDAVGIVTNFNVVNVGGKTADASNGAYMESTGTPGNFGLQPDSSIIRDYLGKVTPVLLVDVDNSTTWKFKVKVYHSDYYEYYDSGWSDEVDGDDISSSEWFMLLFKETDFPPFPVPEEVADADVYENIQRIRFYVFAERVTGSGDCRVDFLWIPRSDHWISLMRAADNDDATCDVDILIHPAAKKVCGVSGSPEVSEVPWESYGWPVDRLILSRGYDYRARFFSLGTTITVHEAIDLIMNYDVRVDGIFGTIYPFEDVGP